MGAGGHCDGQAQVVGSQAAGSESCRVAAVQEHLGTGSLWRDEAGGQRFQVGASRIGRGGPQRRAATRTVIENPMSCCMMLKP